MPESLEKVAPLNRTLGICRFPACEQKSEEIFGYSWLGAVKGLFSAVVVIASSYDLESSYRTCGRTFWHSNADSGFSNPLKNGKPEDIL